MAGEHAGHRQRMRQRFIENDLNGFADHEVLELALFYAIPQRNVNPLAHRLMERFGSLNAVMEAPVQDLCRVEGVGEYAATLLHLFGCMARRMESGRAGANKVLSNFGEACRHCAALLKGLRQEHFYIVCLNAQGEVLRDVLINRGTLDEVQAYPRLVAEEALRHNAHSVILCHNHPGGSIIPSQADVEATRILADLLQKLEIRLVDHIIAAGGDTLSMVHCGLIRQHTGGGQMTASVADSTGEVRIRHELEKKFGIRKE